MGQLITLWLNISKAKNPNSTTGCNYPCTREESTELQSWLRYCNQTITGGRLSVLTFAKSQWKSQWLMELLCLVDCCWCSTLLTTRPLGWERQRAVWEDKVNRLKVNKSSCAWATRGTQLQWCRRTRLAVLRSDEPSDPMRQKYCPLTSCSCQCYMFEAPMVTDRQSCCPTRKRARAASRWEQHRLDLSSRNPRNPPMHSWVLFFLISSRDVEISAEAARHVLVLCDWLRGLVSCRSPGVSWSLAC